MVDFRVLVVHVSVWVGCLDVGRVHFLLLLVLTCLNSTLSCLCHYLFLSESYVVRRKNDRRIAAVPRVFGKRESLGTVAIFILVSVSLQRSLILGGISVVV